MPKSHSPSGAERFKRSQDLALDPPADLIAWDTTLVLTAGVDEAGRGPWVGPVVAAAVILDPRQEVRGLNDSKKLKPEVRARLSEEIRAKAKADPNYNPMQDPQAMQAINLKAGIAVHPGAAPVPGQ
jgi:ribonuclease HIII